MRGCPAGGHTRTDARGQTHADRHTDSEGVRGVQTDRVRTFKKKTDRTGTKEETARGKWLAEGSRIANTDRRLIEERVSFNLKQTTLKWTSARIVQVIVRLVLWTGWQRVRTG